MRNSHIRPFAALAFAWLVSISSLRGQQPLQSNALWVAESSGVFKLDTTNGHLLLEIGGVPSVRTIAVDHRRNSIWFYAGRALYSYSFSGAKLLEVPLTNLLIPIPIIDVPATDLAVLEDDGSVWLAVGRNLLSLAASGQRLHTLQLSETINSLSVDQTHAILWFATDHAVTAYDGVTGSLIRSLSLANVQAVDVDPFTNDLWVAWRDGVRTYSPDGSLIRQVAWPHPAHIAADLRGGAWAATATEVRRIGPSGQTLATLHPFGLLESIVALERRRPRAL
jgi:ligand-binding sensor domain-containing protein